MNKRGHLPRRVDANQNEIVQQLRGLGFHVTLLHTIGGGVPDLVVVGLSNKAHDWLALFVEVKRPGEKLTETEEAWHMKYPDGGPLLIATCLEDILAWFGR